MDCTAARNLLWPPERPRLAGDHIVRAREHVRDCAACASYFAQDQALLDLFDRTRRARAPLAVRERVFDAIARERWDGHRPPGHRAVVTTRPRVPIGLSGGTRPPTWRLGAWPVVVTAAIGALLLLRPDAATVSVEGPEVFVEDYLRRAVGQDHIETDDPAEVQRFLERELGLRFDPLQIAGLKLERAEICLLEGRRGAMIVYKTDGALVSHYVVPRTNVVARAPALSTRKDGPAADMPVVTWATSNAEQALVGGLSSDQLLAIAGHGASED